MKMNEVFIFCHARPDCPGIVWLAKITDPFKRDMEGCVVQLAQYSIYVVSESFVHFSDKPKSDVKVVFFDPFGAGQTSG